METFEVGISLFHMYDYMGADGEDRADRFINALDTFAAVYLKDPDSPLVSFRNHKDDDAELAIIFSIETESRSVALTLASSIVSTALMSMESDDERDRQNSEPDS